MRCEEVRDALPAYVREGHASLPLRRHVARCEECGSELERYEMLLDSLERLRAVPLAPPEGLRAALASIPATARLADKVAWRTGGVRHHLTRNRGAYVGGFVAVVGAAGAALWRTRARRLATA